MTGRHFADLFSEGSYSGILTMLLESKNRTRQMMTRGNRLGPLPPGPKPIAGAGCLARRRIQPVPSTRGNRHLKKYKEEEHR